MEFLPSWNLHSCRERGQKIKTSKHTMYHIAIGAVEKLNQGKGIGSAVAEVELSRAYFI